MPANRLLDLVSPRVGLIREIAPQGRGADEPMPPYLYTATLSNFDFKTASKTDRLAAGKGLTKQDAIASAIGEATERYCAYHWDPNRIHLAPLSAVAHAVSPAECVLYSERQYAAPGWMFARWTPEQDVAWIDGADLLDGSRMAFPASLVYLVFPPPRMEDYFAPATSNGLAAGATLADATLSGLCEVMERDAMLIAWMNRLPATEIDLSAVSGPAGQVCRHYAQRGVELRAFVMPSDLPAATVMAISFESGPGRPANVIGLGCHPDPGIALIKALFELCQGRPAEATRFHQKPPAGRLNTYEDVRTLDDHSAFMSQMDRREEFAFLWQTGAKVRIDEFPNRGTGNSSQDVERCAAALTSAGYRAGFVELTTPDLTDFGIHVVRVIVPGLQPVHFGFGQERLGGERLFSLAQKLGLADRVRTEADLNLCPHPLA